MRVVLSIEEAVRDPASESADPPRFEARWTCPRCGRPQSTRIGFETPDGFVMTPPGTVACGGCKIMLETTTAEP